MEIWCQIILIKHHFWKIHELETFGTRKRIFGKKLEGCSCARKYPVVFWTFHTSVWRANQPWIATENSSREKKAWSPEISAVEPGALSFYWLEPWSIYDCGARSPKTFCAEPGAQHFQVWSFEFPDCIDSCWLLPFCVCLCVLTGIKKQNLKRGQYIIQLYAVISVYNDMQQLI